LSRKANIVPSIDFEPCSPNRMAGKDRRIQLIQTAIKLFSRKGFEGTTTKEIATAAGVTEAMIFRHFATKEDLYAAILDYKAKEAQVDEWLKELGKLAEKRDDEGIFRAIAMRIFTHHRCDPLFIRLMLYSALEGHQLARSFRESQVRPIHQFLHDYVALRQSEKAFSPINPGSVVRAYIGSLIHQVITKELFKKDFFKVDDNEFVENFVDLFLNGLRTASLDKRSSKKRTKSKR
jgi:TetR/AcrR family transcriptional regulator